MTYKEEEKCRYIIGEIIIIIVCIEAVYETQPSTVSVTVLLVVLPPTGGGWEPSITQCILLLLFRQLPAIVR